ncbi:hypothetical protein WAI453_003796 [Rhynchosporium graminicola]
MAMALRLHAAVSVSRLVSSSIVAQAPGPKQFSLQLRLVSGSRLSVVIMSLLKGDKHEAISNVSGDG